MASGLVLVSLAGCESSRNSVKRSDIDSDFAYTPTEKEKRQLRTPSGYDTPAPTPTSTSTVANRPPPAPVPGGPAAPHLIKPTAYQPEKPGSPPPLPASQQARAEEKLKALNAAAKSPSSPTATMKTEKTATIATLKPSEKDKEKEKERSREKEKDKEKSRLDNNPLPPLPGTVKKRESDPNLGTSVAIEPDQPQSKPRPKVDVPERREEPPPRTTSTGSSNPDDRLPTARPVPGKRGFVFSPYVSGVGPVDIRGFASGTKVQCPYTRKVFLVP